jgi:hypothetical protein
MSQETISLLPVEHVEIQILMDNSIDLTLSSTRSLMSFLSDSAGYSLRAQSLAQIGPRM